MCPKAIVALSEMCTQTMNHVKVDVKYMKIQIASINNITESTNRVIASMSKRLDYHPTPEQKMMLK